MADDSLPPDPSQVLPPQTMADLTAQLGPVNTLAPALAGSPGSPQYAQAANQPPRPTPIAYQLISNLIRPPMQASAPGQPARPVSRLDTFENFLGNFVQALGQGLSVAHGPGAAVRGAGAAIGAPYQQSLQQFQLGQQAQANQAEIQQRQAQTQLTAEQAAALPAEQQAKIAAMTAQPRFDPQTHAYLGTMTDAQFANYIKGGQAAGISAQSRITSEQLRLQAQAGQVARVLPGIDPQKNQPAMLAYDKQNRLVGVVPGALDPKLLPKVSTNQQWLQTSPGVWDLVSKTSTSQTVVPGAAPTPSGFPRVQSASTQATPSPAATSGPAAAAGASQYPNVPKLNPQGGRRIVGEVPGIALDPQANGGKGELVQTTSAEAVQKGYQGFQKASGPEFDKYRSAQAQMSDVQINASRYVAAADRAMREGVSAADYANLHSIMNTRGLYDFNLAISQGGHVDLPLIAGFTEAASRAEKSGAYQALSAPAKDLIDGYFRTVSAVPAYMKALTNVGKFNKEQMELEIQNIPNPTMDPRDITRKLGQWNENIAQGASSIPRMKGMDTIRDIRAKYEPQAPATLLGRSAYRTC